MLYILSTRSEYRNAPMDVGLAVESVKNNRLRLVHLNYMTYWTRTPRIYTGHRPRFHVSYNKAFKPVDWLQDREIRQPLYPTANQQA